MGPDELEHWLWEARDIAIETLDEEATWWPTSNNESLPTTAWATAFVIRAALSQLGDIAGNTLAMSGTDASTPPAKIRERMWGPARGVNAGYQAMLDYSVNDWTASNPIRLTAESEASATEPCGPWTEVGSKSYSWDFYKLMVVPSPIRLFFAVVGTIEQHENDRLGAVEAELQRQVVKYSGTLLRPKDELGVILLPQSKANAFDGRTRILWADNGRLMGRNAVARPKVWKGKQ